MKGYRDAWAISLLIIGVVTLFITITSFIDLGLPDALMRVLGVLDLCALVVLAFTTVKLKIWKKDEQDTKE